MFNKSIAATIGIALISVVVSMSEVQEEAQPATANSIDSKDVFEAINKSTTRWERTGDAKSQLRDRFFTLSSKRRDDEKTIKEAARALRQGITSEEQEAAKATLAELLGADYDSRLADYEKHLEKLEKQLAVMRGKLEKRREAKAKMIELRIEVLKAEADDLGWPSRMSDRFGSSNFPGRFGSIPQVNGFTRFEPTTPVQTPGQPVPPPQPKLPAKAR